MFCRGAVGGLFISVYQSVGWLLGKSGLLLVLVHVVLLHLGVVCPYFGDFRVFVLVVFNGDSICSVFLNGVFDLVQLLPHVVGGVVVGGRVGVAALLSALPHAPVEHGDQAADPGYRQHRAQQGHQEICRRQERVRAAANHGGTLRDVYRGNKSQFLRLVSSLTC